MLKSNVDPSKYVVLDVETNGLSSMRDDLLSLSIYKPDTDELYNRFLPLELNTRVTTTAINGIKTCDLKGLSPLTQEEIDKLIQVFDLKTRIVLTYGTLDARFIEKYFQRHRLRGLDYFAFYNFKHEIISSRYSEGNISKDNLCNMYGIENVTSIHSGDNDCILEWKLFEHMNGHRLLVTNNKVFEFNSNYIVPASYIGTYPNFKYFLPKIPEITCRSRMVFSLTVESDKLKKFPTNFNGCILEHLINSMLHVQPIDSERFLIENKKQLKYLGELPSTIDIVPMQFNQDGSMTATRPQDETLAREINAEILSLKGLFRPLIDYIADNIFFQEAIKSQELIVHSKENVLALCDLSNEKAVLEIKATDSAYIQHYAEQLYYESNGRKCFVLMTNWDQYPQSVSYVIHEVEFDVVKADSEEIRFEKARKKIESRDRALLSFVDTRTPVRVRCKTCGNEWNMSYPLAIKRRLCPECCTKSYAQLSRLEEKKHQK